MLEVFSYACLVLAFVVGSLLLFTPILSGWIQTLLVEDKYLDILGLEILADHYRSVLRGESTAYTPEELPEIQAKLARCEQRLADFHLDCQGE